MFLTVIYISTAIGNLKVTQSSFPPTQQCHMESQVLVALPSSVRNQDVTQRPPQTKYPYETTEDHMLNDTAQNPSTSQPTVIPNSQEPTMPLSSPSAPEIFQELIVSIPQPTANPSTSQRSTTPINQLELGTTIPRSISAAKEISSEQILGSVPRIGDSSVNALNVSELEPVPKRSKQESSSIYKPGRNEALSSTVTLKSAYNNFEIAFIQILYLQ